MCNTYTTVLLILLWFNDLLVSIFFCLFYLYLFFFSSFFVTKYLVSFFTAFFCSTRNKNTNKILFKRFEFIWIQFKCTAEHLLILVIFWITTTNISDKKFVFFTQITNQYIFIVKRFAWKRIKTNFNYSRTVSSECNCLEKLHSKYSQQITSGNTCRKIISIIFFGRFLDWRV